MSHVELVAQVADAPHRGQANGRRSPSPTPWWRDAVIYQIYPRSFADGNGDGTGDIAGIRRRLPYLRELGIDAIWLTPWYASPLADGGYDVADYRAIDPAFGTLAEAERLIVEARATGHPDHRGRGAEPRLGSASVVPAGARRGPGSAQRARFWFKPGRGERGEEKPNDWLSSFGGDAWTRTVGGDGAPGEWYLHLFSPEQPDLNWDHPDVHREHEDILRFWFDRGVAGIRIDSAAMLVKDSTLPELPDGEPAPGEHPHLDRDDLHDIYRSWRRIADSYDEPRVLVGEVWLADAARFAAYLRPDEMHSAFNFDFMTRPWDARGASGLDRTHARRARPGRRAGDLGAVQPRHHAARHPLRAGGLGFSFDRKRFGVPVDLELGTRRARAAALLTAALPGVLYIYQGDELGLPEAELPPPRAAGSDALPLGRRRPRSGRMPRSAAVER